MKRIASVAVKAGERLLIGKRSDDHRWNLPGGHVDEGETPEQGAARELREETGIDVDPSRLVSLREPEQVITFTGKHMEIHSYLLVLPDVCDTKREGTDPGEAHDWAWVNVSTGLPPDIAMNWHNKRDTTMEALGLPIAPVNALDKSDDLEKAWPKDYDRVKGQDSKKGVASKKQYYYMKGRGDEVGKDYVANSPKGGEGLPESGTGGARGARGKGHEKGKGSDRAEKANDEDDIRGEAIKRMNRPKVKTFQEQVASIKQRHAEKPAPSLAEQVKAVKDKYKTKMAKSTDLFFGKLEGLLDKGFANEELVSHIMDVELLARSTGDESSLEALYKSTDNLFDMTMSKEEQAVYELSYLAREGDEVALYALEKFVVEMHDELMKSATVEDVVSDAVFEALEKRYLSYADLDKYAEQAEKSNYGPKIIGGEKVSLYNQTDNINRKATRTGVQHENVGHNRSEQRYTPSANGTFAQQATREAKRDQQKSKQNPVKVYTEEEKRAFAAAREKTNKSEDNSKVVGKKNGHSVRKVHGYYRYTSGPKRGEYVHRHEAEKRLGRKLGSKEHVDHKDGNRGSTKNTRVMSAGAHAAKTNKSRANGKGYSGGKRYEHTRD